MGFSQVRFINYRNIKNTLLDLSHNQVFFVGENGQGKTNVLEAIYFLSYGSSFRTRNTKLLIQEGTDSMGLLGQWIDPEEAIDSGLSTEVKVEVKNDSKSFFVDKERVKDRKELGEKRPSIVFCHDDINFVRGAPEDQRWFFDQSLALYDPSYIEVLRNYRRILKQRNSFLKQQQNPSLLEVLDQQLVETGLSLVASRNQLTQQVSEIYKRLYAKISGLDGTFWIQYKPNWAEAGNGNALAGQEPIEDQHNSLLDKLLAQRDQDFRMKTTTSGPHRDKYLFMRDTDDFVATASTGQIRLLSLILRVAQSKIVTEIRHLKPILLFDDVLLELDPVKRQRFLAELPEYSQSFYTFLPGEPIEEYFSSDPLVYDVSDGIFHERRQ
jgi:DNA replication and repair protein RecF